ncbi:hypothetical protein EAG21025_42990 (plasmid) [Enterobacter asburiae]
MGVKITGIDKLQKQLKEVEEAAETLNGSYPVNFDANDPVSIETAIQEAYCVLLSGPASVCSVYVRTRFRTDYPRC